MKQWQYGIPILFTLLTTQVNALTLEDVLAIGREQNPSIEASLSRIQAADAAVEAARSGYYPTITLAGGYTRTDNPPQAFFMNLNQRQASLQNDFNNPPDTGNYRGSLSFRLLLLDAGQRGLMTEMASRNQEATRAMLDAAHNELAYQVTRAFYSVLQAAAQVTVHDETVRSLEEHTRVARARQEAGSAIITDVLNLEVQLAEAREQLIRARNGEQRAIAALNTATGSDVVRESGSLVIEDSEVPPPDETFDADAYLQRPELIAAGLRSEAAGFDAARYRRDRMPRLSAFGAIDYDSEDASDFEESYLVGAMIEMDLFTGGRRGADIAGAIARAKEAEAMRDELINQLRLDLTQSFLQMNETWERREVASQSVNTAVEALRITRERYEQGVADVTELLTAQVGYTATRSRSVSANYDYLIARSNLKRALGILSTSSNQ